MAEFRFATIDVSTDGTQLRLIGDWTLHGIEKLQAEFPAISKKIDRVVCIDGSAINLLDTAGAWLVQKLLSEQQTAGHSIQYQGLSDEHNALMRLIGDQALTIKPPPPRPKSVNLFYAIGKAAVSKFDLLVRFVEFIGEVTLMVLNVLQRPRRLQWHALWVAVDETGYEALPIIALLSFLIGIVLAYQMGLQLKIYGANIFIVEITGIAILREFGPLITAIIMAGRTSSAFTAEIGTMKINEEIDVLRTMGLSPINRLVLPKILGMLISTPLLIVWAMIFGVMGSMFMSNITLQINYYDFLSRFVQEVSISNYVVGLVKSPVFALLVAGVGCFQGFRVSGSADSIGHQTTKSVVQAIFLIIIADAIFSVLFSWKGI